ncbi:MAG: M23 family metallopeptidase [Paracoccaceae bacterium]|tara:strand:- start:1683 stop:2558 length:876 start_codon:yes stop_codon:yes gene_type:complete
MRIFYPLNLLHLISVTSIILISGCDTNLNYSQYLDLPKNLYQSVSASGPAPKETGIITFETYAIVRAKKGERLFNVADRINVSSKKLAVHNGVSENYQLGQGEVLAIPLNILPNHNDGSINIAKVASKAIDRVKTEQESEVEEKIEQTDQSEKNETIGTNVSENVTSTSEMNLKTYIKPIDGEISSPFSYDVNGNQGINIQAPQGEPVKATNDGTIVLVSRGSNQPTVVLIRHDSEILSAYSNISDVNLSKGDRVKRGQIIGVVSMGADHLHFEIIKGTDRIDPITFLEGN